MGFHHFPSVTKMVGALQRFVVRGMVDALRLFTLRARNKPLLVAYNVNTEAT